MGLSCSALTALLLEVADGFGPTESFYRADEETGADWPESWAPFTPAESIWPGLDSGAPEGRFGV
jgi:hypothetical protein